MGNRYLALLYRNIARLLLDDLTFKFEGLDVVGKVIEVYCSGWLSKKLDALDANL